MVERTGIFELSKAFFKIIVAISLAIFAARWLRGFIILIGAGLLSIILKTIGDSQYEPRRKTELIYSLIGPNGGYPPCFASDACAPEVLTRIKEANACLTQKPDCTPDTQQIIDKIKHCLADHSCSHDVNQLFQKETEEKYKERRINQYVIDGPPACYEANSCAPEIIELVKQAETRRQKQ